MTTETKQNNPNQSEEAINTESFVKLRKLTTKDGEPIEDILHRAAEQMGGLAEKATIQLRLIRVDETTTKHVYSIQLTSSGALLEMESLIKPTLVVITTAKAFRQIAEGSYSPVQAYLDGRLHLQGDVDLGKRVILHLAGSGTDVNVCPLLDAQSWQPNGNGGGTLKFSGFNFTPGGRVFIQFDPPGGAVNPPSQYPPLRIVADARGRFTVQTTEIECKNGGVVTVSALDISTGQNLISGDVNYPIPC